MTASIPLSCLCLCRVIGNEVIWILREFYRLQVPQWSLSRFFLPFYFVLQTSFRDISRHDSWIELEFLSPQQRILFSKDCCRFYIALWNGTGEKNEPKKRIWKKNPCRTVISLVSGFSISFLCSYTSNLYDRLALFYFLFWIPRWID